MHYSWVWFVFIFIFRVRLIEICKSNEREPKATSSYMKLANKNFHLNIIQEGTIFSQPGNFLFWPSWGLFALVKLLDAVTFGPEITEALELVLEFCTWKIYERCLLTMWNFFGRDPYFLINPNLEKMIVFNPFNFRKIGENKFFQRFTVFAISLREGHVKEPTSKKFLKGIQVLLELRAIKQAFEAANGTSQPLWISERTPKI